MQKGMPMALGFKLIIGFHLLNIILWTIGQAGIYLKITDCLNSIFFLWNVDD